MKTKEKIILTIIILIMLLGSIRFIYNILPSKKRKQNNTTMSILTTTTSETTTSSTTTRQTTKTSKKSFKKKSNGYTKKDFNITYSVQEIKEYLQIMVSAYGYSNEHYDCAVKLMSRESNFNPNSVNRRSGACGLAQANPCNNKKVQYQYTYDWKYQVRWYLDYIKNRYKTPCNAWKHFRNHGSY